MLSFWLCKLGDFISNRDDRLDTGRPAGILGQKRRWRSTREAMLIAANKGTWNKPHAVGSVIEEHGIAWDSSRSSGRSFIDTEGGNSDLT
jgi:hypothetical protein